MGFDPIPQASQAYALPIELQSPNKLGCRIRPDTSDFIPYTLFRIISVSTLTWLPQLESNQQLSDSKSELRTSTECTAL